MQSVTNVEEIHSNTELIQSKRYINVEANRRPCFFQCAQNDILPADAPDAVMHARRQLNLRIVCSSSDADTLNLRFPVSGHSNLRRLDVIRNLVQSKADSLCLGLQITTELDNSFLHALNDESLTHMTPAESLDTRFDCSEDENEITVIVSSIYMGVYFADKDQNIIALSLSGLQIPTILLHEIGHILATDHPNCRCNLCNNLTSHFMYPRLSTSDSRAEIMVQDWLAIIDACGISPALCSSCPNPCEPEDPGHCWDCPLPATIHGLHTDTTGISIGAAGEFRRYAKPDWHNDGTSFYARWQSLRALEFYEERYFAFILQQYSLGQSIDAVPKGFNFKKFNMPGLFRRINPKLTAEQEDKLKGSPIFGIF